MEEKTNTAKIKIPKTVTVKKFSEILGMPVSDVIKELLKNGILATINEEIDFESASIIAQDLGFETEEDIEHSEKEAMTLEKLLEICRKEKNSGKNLHPRPPVVTILGHVDHGKTTLLDTIRKESVAAKEAGGITQHITAYQAKKKGKLITFVDTPGHEAFSGMRERGVSIADIAVLVVAADDGVRPQTKEVIEYLKEKKIPTVIAINKVDKPEANIQKVKQELADNEMLIEEWGGDKMSAEVSAKNNIGIDDLLENILLVAEVEDLKADSNRDGLGVVLESHLDPNRGPVATVLIKTGALKVGHDVVAGKTYGRIKKIEDFKGQAVSSAGPSTPISIMGLNHTANVNDVIQVVSGKAATKSKLREGGDAFVAEKERLTTQNIIKKIEDKKIHKLNIILKVDVQGSLEAIEQILSAIESTEVAINYVEVGVGNVTESDIKIAESSGSTIFGFNINTTPVAKRFAESSKVEIKVYSVIYELVEEIRSRMADLLPIEIIRTDYGKMEILGIFRTERNKMIVGGEVIEGAMVKDSLVEIYRQEKLIGKGKLSELQQNKIPVDEVKKGNECGLIFEGEAKIKMGDIIHNFSEEEKKKSL